MKVLGNQWEICTRNVYMKFAKIGRVLSNWKVRYALTSYLGIMYLIFRMQALSMHYYDT